ncbi:hypothetical protein BDF22DRAFT_746581 [Syncephalis plumigaleata]|nr:hypothetical protein BDF22DRAFT_746581 [Syncephalis plumigaleata]
MAEPHSYAIPYESSHNHRDGAPATSRPSLSGSRPLPAPPSPSFYPPPPSYPPASNAVDAGQHASHSRYSPAPPDNGTTPMSSSLPSNGGHFNGGGIAAAYKTTSAGTGTKTAVRSRSSSVRSFNSHGQRPTESLSRTNSPLPRPPPPAHPPPPPHQHTTANTTNINHNNNTAVPPVPSSMRQPPWDTTTNQYDPNTSTTNTPMPPFRPMPMPEPARPPSSFVRIEKWLDQTELPANDDPELVSGVVNEDDTTTTNHNNHNGNHNGNGNDHITEPVTKNEPSSNHYPTTSHLDLSQSVVTSPQMSVHPDTSSQQHQYQQPHQQHQQQQQQHLTSNYASTKMEAPRPSMDRNRPSMDHTRRSTDRNRVPYEGQSEYGTSPPNQHHLHSHPVSSSMQQPSHNSGMQLPVPPVPPIQTTNLTVNGHGPASPHSFHSSPSQHSPTSHQQHQQHQHQHQPPHSPSAYATNMDTLTPAPPAYPVSPTTSGDGGVSYGNMTDRPSAAVHPSGTGKSYEPMHSMELTPLPGTPRAGNHAPYIDYNNQPCAAGGVHDFAREWTFFDYLCVAICCPCYCSALCVKSILCSCASESPQVSGDKVCGCGASGPKLCQKCGLRYDDMLAGRVRRHRLQ